MTSYLILTAYEPESEMHQSDQITIPADLWTTYDSDHDGSAPMFVELGDQTGVFGRLRPAVPSEGLSNDSCRVPQWMWMRMGCPDGDEFWAALTKCTLPTAGTIVLRARHERDITESDDPVAMLTAALSGAGGGLSWACLSTGSELPLLCGMFDVMEIRSVDDTPVPAASILNCDVNLELMPALDAPSVPVVAADASALHPSDSSRQQVAAPCQQVAAPCQQVAAPYPSRTGFIPFSGVGRRLCD